MTSVEEMIERGLEEPEMPHLPEELFPKLPCIENLTDPVVATEEGKACYEREREHFEDEGVRKEVESASSDGRWLGPMAYEIRVLKRFVKSTEKLERGEITTRQHVRALLEYTWFLRRGLGETRLLSFVNRLQKLLKNLRLHRLGLSSNLVERLLPLLQDQ